MATNYIATALRLELENQFLKTALSDVLDALEDLMAGGSHTDAESVLEQYRPDLHVDDEPHVYDPEGCGCEKCGALDIDGTSDVV